MWKSGGIDTEQAPIGVIIGWDKTLSGVPTLPSEYVQCDGQVLSDAESPLNGTTIPDLNGNNYFLRGNSTSGSTGGAATVTLTATESGLAIHGATSSPTSHAVSDPSHDHSYNRGDIVSRDSGGTTTGGTGGGFSSLESSGLSVDNSSSADAASAHNNLPQYYNVVWVIRVK
jgi:microcystin-dependent protein